jgi:lipopolysaccharide export system protein LptA
MKMKWLRQIWVIGLVFCAGVVFAQTTPPTISEEQDEVQVDYADTFENIQTADSTVQKFRGNVELRQDSIFMYCDSATIVNKTYVVAQGNVIIQQGDTTSVFADSLVYQGDVKQAVLFGNVALVNGEQKLFTDRLDYDLNTKTAVYTEGATLTNEDAQLSSKRGYYYVRADEVFFRDSVVVIDPEFNLRSDTLKFNTQTRTVFFLAPTLISSDSTKIYCEDGFYDMENNLAEFRKNAQFARSTQEAVADTIRYNGRNEVYDLRGNARFTDENQKAVANSIKYEEQNDKYYLTGDASYQDSTRNIVAEEIIYDRKNELYSTTGRSRVVDPPQILEADQIAYTEGNGTGVALGNIIWQDTSANLTIVCERADYNRSTNYLKALGGREGRPLLITEIEEDSLFLSSDTLLALQTVDTLTQDTARTLFAYHNVRIFKSNLQAICDSLTYSGIDSTFRLYDNRLNQTPIIWSDTTQFIADTVDILLKNNEIDRIFLQNNAFIVNSPDNIYFNQVKGRDITAFFEAGELRRMDVQGNAESIYYALDEEDAYIGVNNIQCSEMLMYFGNNQVDNIRFYTSPEGALLPMKQTDHQSLRLDGFTWEVSRRPKDRDEVLVAGDTSDQEKQQTTSTINEKLAPSNN